MHSDDHLLEEDSDEVVEVQTRPRCSRASLISLGCVAAALALLGATHPGGSQEMSREGGILSTIEAYRKRGYDRWGKRRNQWKQWGSGYSYGLTKVDTRTCKCGASKKDVMPFVYQKLLGYSDGCTMGAPADKFYSLMTGIKTMDESNANEVVYKTSHLYATKNSRLVDYMGKLVKNFDLPPPTHYLVMRPKKLTTAVLAYEMLENYAWRLLATVPYDKFHDHPTVETVVTGLNMAAADPEVKEYVQKYRWTNYYGKRSWKSLLMFAGNDGVQYGPVVSQFHVLPHMNFFDGRWVEAMYNTETGAGVHMTEELYIAMEEGKVGFQKKYDRQGLKVMATHDVFGGLVHSDELMVNLHDALHMLTRSNLRQDLAWDKKMVEFHSDYGCAANEMYHAEAIREAMNAAFTAKWQSGRARPENMAHLVDKFYNCDLPGHEMQGEACTCLRDYASAWWTVMGSSRHELNPILEMTNKMQGNLELEMLYQEGSPSHPSYVAGHSAAAGASVTIMKLLYNMYEDKKSCPPKLKKWSDFEMYDNEMDAESLRRMMGDLKVHYSCCTEENPDCHDDLKVNPPCIFEASSKHNKYFAYKGRDWDKMTVVGELHKLMNYYLHGRDVAGVHYFSDGYAGSHLGEKVAMQYMHERMKSWVSARAGVSEELMMPMLSGKHCKVSAKGFHVLDLHSRRWKYYGTDANQLYESHEEMDSLADA